MVLSSPCLTDNLTLCFHLTVFLLNCTETWRSRPYLAWLRVWWCRPGTAGCSWESSGTPGCWRGNRLPGICWSGQSHRWAEIRPGRRPAWGEVPCEQKSRSHLHISQIQRKTVLYCVTLTMTEGHIKGIVQPKIKLHWKCTHPPAIQDVDEFVSSSEQNFFFKFSIMTLAH